MNASPDIETRLRAHLAAERETIKPPADLEARVLRHLKEPRATPAGSGLVRRLALRRCPLRSGAGLTPPNWHGRRRQGFGLRQRPRATRASGAGRPLPAEWHHRPRRWWSGVSRWQALVAASGSGMDGPRLARWWRRLNANQFPPPLWGRIRVGVQRDAAADRRLPNLERAADGRDAILTRLHL